MNNIFNLQIILKKNAKKINFFYLTKINMKNLHIKNKSVFFKIKEIYHINQNKEI